MTTDSSVTLFWLIECIQSIIDILCVCTEVMLLVVAMCLPSLSIWSVLYKHTLWVTKLPSFTRQPNTHEQTSLDVFFCQVTFHSVMLATETQVNVDCWVKVDTEWLAYEIFKVKWHLKLHRLNRAWFSTHFTITQVLPTILHPGETWGRILKRCLKLITD